MFYYSSKIFTSSSKDTHWSWSKSGSCIHDWSIPRQFRRIQSNSPLLQPNKVTKCVSIFSNSFVSADCPFVLTADSGTIHTPNFPGKHPNNITCIWNIKVQPGRFILLSFHVFDLESYRGKCIDLVEVKDGGRQTDELLGEYAGYTLRAGLSWLQQLSDSTKQLALGIIKNTYRCITMVHVQLKVRNLYVLDQYSCPSLNLAKTLSTFCLFLHENYFSATTATPPGAVFLVTILINKLVKTQNRHHITADDYPQICVFEGYCYRRNCFDLHCVKGKIRVFITCRCFL